MLGRHSVLFGTVLRRNKPILLLFLQLSVPQGAGRANPTITVLPGSSRDRTDAWLFAQICGSGNHVWSGHAKDAPTDLADTKQSMKESYQRSESRVTPAWLSRVDLR